MFTVYHNYFYCDYSLSCQLGQSDCGGVGVTVKNNYCSTKKGEPVESVHKLTELRKLRNCRCCCTLADYWHCISITRKPDIAADCFPEETCLIKPVGSVWFAILNDVLLVSLIIAVVEFCSAGHRFLDC